MNHELYEILKTLNGIFSDSIKKLMEIIEITVDKLAEKINVSLAICIAMKLPPDLSMYLIEASGHRFKITEEDLIYKFLIRSCYTKTIDECNQYLINEGFESLTKSNDAMDANP